MSEPRVALIIEDDEDLSYIFSEALRESGFVVEPVRDGKVARERLKQFRPAVIVLDLHLPNVGGIDLLKDIRTLQHLEGVRVVVTTADARLGEQSDGLADFVLIKPIGFHLLRDLTARL